MPLHIQRIAHTMTRRSDRSGMKRAKKSDFAREQSAKVP